MPGRTWTPAEDALLRAADGGGRGAVRDAAAKLGRSYESTAIRFNRLGCSIYARWSTGEDALLRAASAADLASGTRTNQRRAAKALGRTACAVFCRVLTLRARG